MSAHTPGPWIWSHRNGHLCRVGEPPFACGATVLVPTYEYETGVDVAVSEADANLISAAPDLLDALDGIVHFSDGFVVYHHDSPVGDALRQWINAARAAIAKAKGDPA